MKKARTVKVNIVDKQALGLGEVLFNKHDFYQNIQNVRNSQELLLI